MANHCVNTGSSDDTSPTLLELTMLQSIMLTTSALCTHVCVWIKLTEEAIGVFQVHTINSNIVRIIQRSLVTTPPCMPKWFCTTQEQHCASLCTNSTKPHLFGLAIHHTKCTYHMARSHFPLHAFFKRKSVHGVFMYAKFHIHINFSHMACYFWTSPLSLFMLWRERVWQMEPHKLWTNRNLCIIFW